MAAVTAVVDCEAKCDAKPGLLDAHDIGTAFGFRNRQISFGGH